MFVTPGSNDNQAPKETKPEQSPEQPTHLIMAGAQQGMGSNPGSGKTIRLGHYSKIKDPNKDPANKR